jgi:fermentation-respiration switch protein FrsA (DUF1100 family)
MKSKILRVLSVLLAAYLSVLGYIYFNQTNLLYFPDKDMGVISDYNLGDTKEIFLTSADGAKIQTWVHSPTGHKPMVIWLHGNSYNLAQRKDKFRELIKMGYGLIAPSWHGFGKSEGRPGIKEIYDDARAAVNYLQQLGYKTEDTIIIGESLGSGVAVQMAVEHRFKEVFLITPYTSIADRAQEIYWYLPVKQLVKDNFESYDKIDRIDAPLLIVHGDKDDVIPHSHAEKLFAKALEPKKLIIYPGKGHSNLDINVIFTEMANFTKTSETDGKEVTHK